MRNTPFSHSIGKLLCLGTMLLCAGCATPTPEAPTIEAPTPEKTVYTFAASLPAATPSEDTNGAELAPTGIASPATSGAFGGAKDYEGVTIPVTVNGEAFQLAATTPHWHYDLVSANTEFPTTLTLGQVEGYDVSVNGLPLAPGASCQVQFRELSARETIKLTLTSQETGKETYAYFNSLHSAYTPGIVTSNAPEAGYYYFNDPQFAIKIDTNGAVVFYRYEGGGFDFHRTEVDDQVFYSFLAKDEGNYAVVMNERYEVIDRVTGLMDYAGLGGMGVDSHDFDVLGKNHYVLASYHPLTPDNLPTDLGYGPTVTAAVIQEIQDGEVLFQWNSTDYPVYYPAFNGGNVINDATDYMHLNSICMDPKDNNFIVSFRHMDCVSKIDRETGKILWHLGGDLDQFGLTEEQKFSYQHDAVLTPDGALTLFNNDNSDGTTSVMRFELDEETKTVVSFKEYTYLDGYAGYLGSAQELGTDHLLIGWGGRYSNLPTFSELDFATNTVLFEYDLPTAYAHHTYRVYKDAQ